LRFEIPLSCQNQGNDGIAEFCKSGRVESFGRNFGEPIFPDTFARLFDDENFECVRRIGVWVDLPGHIEALGEGT
jgi:hypothetical protein